MQWWARRDSNPQAVRHRILNPACLPISPLARCNQPQDPPAVPRSGGRPAHAIACLQEILRVCQFHHSPVVTNPRILLPSRVAGAGLRTP